MIKCQICGREFNGLKGLGSHISQTHKISSKEYYDLYLKKVGEGICPECGNKTNFDRLSKGYRKFCSLKCSSNSKIVKKKKEQTYLKNYGVNHNFKLKEVKEKRKETWIENYGVNHPSKNKIIIDKTKQTFLKKYGVDNPTKCEKIKEKTKQTCIKKYGVDNPNKTKEVREKIKQTNIKNGNWTNSKDLKGWELYKFLVQQETNKWKKQLYENWDGLDYYTNKKLITNEEYKEIEPNKHLNANLFQPTIDHKISRMKGFQEGILPMIIGHINNLCICGKGINSKKGNK